MNNSPTTKQFLRLHAAGLTTPARLRIMYSMTTLTNMGVGPFTINDIHSEKKVIGDMQRSVITETIRKFRNLPKPLVKQVGTEDGKTRPSFLFELTAHGKRMGEILGW